MKRDNCFDFLRFVFAFNVVLGHMAAITIFQETAPFDIFNTYLSVTGFFVISGFLITQSYEHSDVKSYFAKRARRLLPAYLFVVLACAFGLAGLSTLPAADYFRSAGLWEYLGANLCFLNFLHPSLPGVFEHPLITSNSVNPSLWTLKIEVGFYLIVPLMFLWLKKAKRPWLVLILVYVLAVLYRNGLNLYGDRTQQEMPIFLARQLPGFMSYFAAGMAAYLYKEQWLRYKNYLIIPALLVFVAEHYTDVEILTPAAWGIMVLWCAYSLPALNNFAKYGDISYGIYIYHAPLLKTLLYVGLFTRIGVWPATAVYVACVVLVGLCSWHLLENRFLKRKKIV